MAGRPRIYENVEDLDIAIDDYFYPMVTSEDDSNCGLKLSTPYKSTTRLKRPTVTGLALHLGFADKTTLYEYRDRPEYSYSIRKALTMIEQYHEEGLSENNVAGRIFALKNMGWKDKTEQDIKYPDGVALNFNTVPSVKPLYETKGDSQQ